MQWVSGAAEQRCSFPQAGDSSGIHPSFFITWPQGAWQQGSVLFLLLREEKEVELPWSGLNLFTCITWGTSWRSPLSWWKTSVHGKQCFAETSCMGWRVGSNRSGFENTLVLYFKMTLFQFFSFSIKCNKDWGIQNRDFVVFVFVFNRIELYLINLKVFRTCFLWFGVSWNFFLKFLINLN